MLVKKEFDEQFINPPEWSKDHVAENKEDEKPRELSLRNSLIDHMTREQLGKNDEWYCRRCKEHVQAFKKMDIWRLPPLLVFQLKRFTYEVGKWNTYREKLENFVSFPFEIDLAEFVIGDSTHAPSTMYELVAVSNHMGGLGGGHYTAYARRGNKWYHCNDSSVREVRNWQHVIAVPAYSVLLLRD